MMKQTQYKQTTNNDETDTVQTMMKQTQYKQTMMKQTQYKL